MQSVDLGQEHGLDKKAKLVSIEINDEERYIRVGYRVSHFIPNPAQGENPEFKQSGLQHYMVTGVDYDDWENSQAGTDIAAAVVAKLEGIFGVNQA